MKPISMILEEYDARMLSRTDPGVLKTKGLGGHQAGHGLVRWNTKEVCTVLNAEIANRAKAMQA